MVTAQSAKTAFLAITFLVAAHVFIIDDTWAASGNTQVCKPSSSCQVGEFLYNDSYSPITDATCTITSRYPDGSLHLNSQAMTAASDGWYSHEFTAPSTEGIYRTQVCCTSGSDYLCLDKTFEVGQAASLSQGDIASAVWNADKASYNSSDTFGKILQGISIPSSSDIASSVWGYSSRSLTGFGTLVADIWGNSERTLTSPTSAGDTFVTTSDIKQINQTTTETRNLLEELINKPVIESSIEEGEDLQTKINTTQTIADSLVSNTNYIKSKTILADNKWRSFNETEILKLFGELEKTISSKEKTDSLVSQAGWIKEQWDWKIGQEILAQITDIKNKTASIQKNVAGKGKSDQAKKELRALNLSVGKLETLIGKTSDPSKTNSLFGKYKETVQLAQSLDGQINNSNSLLAVWGQAVQDKNSTYGKIGLLSKDVSLINKLPKYNVLLLGKADGKDTDKALKNKVLGLRGVAFANKQLLAAKPGSAFSNTWLEEGSIVFKTLISNPSEKISQTVPLKYYLPKEVKKEHITKIDDGLSVNFDAEKDQYFVKGEFELEPSQTKTFSIAVDDKVFVLTDEELGPVRKQAGELSQILNKNSSYFAQGVTLKSDIDASLDKAGSLQSQATTPEAKIRAYREATIEFNAAKNKLEKLKEVAALASSTGSFLGFVGGTQAIAAWGLIIIMVAGFVFLAIYMRMLKVQELARPVGLDVSGKRKHPEYRAGLDEIEEMEEIEENPRKLRPKARMPKAFKLAVMFIGFGVVVAVVSGLIVSKVVLASKPEQVNSKKSGLESYNAPVTKVAEPVEASASAKVSEVLGVNNPLSQPGAADASKITVFVPSGVSVGVYAQASLNSQILVSLSSSVEAVQTEASDNWVKVKIEGKYVEGWVERDFIEKDEEKTSDKVSDAGLGMDLVTISETPTGFLRVRKTPGGKEIGKVDPGESLVLVSEENGWVEVTLTDGSNGWVSKKYTSLAD